VARLIRVLGGDFALAEEVAQEAFTAALEQWPIDGVPPEPRAWLMRAARNKAIDRLRRRSRFERPLDDELERRLQDEPAELSMSGDQDDMLRLIFTCCHPALGLEAQVALTLRTVCGLTTEEIARAFLVETPTMAQRLVRAKTKIKVAGIPYVIPGEADVAERLDAVLAVVYLVFSEGYAATAGDALIRRELAAEAIRIGRLLERLLPGRVEAQGLLALMLLHDSRRDARVDAAGDLILLEDQERSRWDQQQIAEGLQRLDRALATGEPINAYTIQAAIAALHARAPRAVDTDWREIALLYAALSRLTPGPVVRLNHAVAVAMAEGPEQGLLLLEPLAHEQDMQGYHLFFSARADLLRRAGRFVEAHADYERARALAQNAPEKRYLSRRLSELQALLSAGSS
jgi:RNA polymerase sigma-70 factor, ECF subfamily